MSTRKPASRAAWVVTGPIDAAGTRAAVRRPVRIEQHDLVVISDELYDQLDEIS